MDEALFDLEPTVPAPTGPPLSKDRRRRQLQAGKLTAGAHPLSAALRYRIPLHPEAAPVDDRQAPGRRCGNCWFRELFQPRDRTYPKCTFGKVDTGRMTVLPRVTHGPGTDVAAWWPACDDHSWGDQRLSPDAARWVPPAVDRPGGAT